VAQTLVDQPVEQGHPVIRGFPFSARHPIRVIDAGKQAAKPFEFGTRRSFGDDRQLICRRSIASLCIAVDEAPVQAAGTRVGDIGFAGESKCDVGRQDCPGVCGRAAVGSALIVRCDLVEQAREGIIFRSVVRHWSPPKPKTTKG
jgi:hypothetical protein